jgi:DNA-binding transcriptional regulator YiaG
LKLNQIGISNNLPKIANPPMLIEFMKLEDIRAKESTKKQWSRTETVDKVIDFEQKPSELSQRKFCNINGVPRSTLQYWISRKSSIDANAVIIDFFETPEGLAFLHRLLNSAHFAFCKTGTASIHNMSEFLKLSGLSAFVASSYGSQQKISEQMDEVITEFSTSTTPDLIAKMRSKTMTVCEDETFHPEICMVAIEPVSNFILLEQYAKDRTGKTWNNLIESALEPLPVTVIQATSDAGTGLLNHVKNGLKAHHSPDLFHVTYDISKGCSAALNSVRKKAEKYYEEKQKLTQKARFKKQELLQKNPQASENYIQLFEKVIEKTQSLEDQALEELNNALENQNTVRESRLEMGEIYHPYHLETGKPQSPEEVHSRLASAFSKIYQATSSLSDSAKKHIDKAHRVIEEMKATIAFFFLTIHALVKHAEVSPEMEQLMLEHWIPALYFQSIAPKQTKAQSRQKFEEISQHHLGFLAQPDSALKSYSEQKQQQLAGIAKDCADLFQRSSSCVEGRNAQLSLRHHHLHRLSHKKISASTTIHNFHIKRRDGTTAAERFFEQKHQNLFQWVLDHMDIPLRPRAKNRSYQLDLTG